MKGFLPKYFSSSWSLAQYKVGEGVVADVFREADLDGDGKVTFKDYARILNLGQLETVASAAAASA